MQKQVISEVQKRLLKPEFTEVQECLAHTVFYTPFWNKERNSAEITALLNSRHFVQEEIKTLKANIDAADGWIPRFPEYSVALRFGMFAGGTLVTQFIYTEPNNKTRTWTHIKFKSNGHEYPIDKGDSERILYGGSVMSFLMEFLLATRVVTDADAVERLLYGAVDRTLH